MLDTNLVNVGNIKAVVNKIKTWVIERLPIRYSNNNLSIYDLKTLNNKIIGTVSSGSNVTTSINARATDVNANKIDVTSDSISAELTGNVGGIVQNNNDIKVYGKNFTSLSDSSSQNKIELSSYGSGKDVEVKFNTALDLNTNNTSFEFKNGALVLKDNTGNNHGAFLSGKQPSDITDWAEYKLYTGHNNYIGKTFSRDSSGSMVSGTTYGGFKASDTGLMSLNNLQWGTYIACYSLGLSAGTPDGKKISGMWYITDTDGTAETTALLDSRNTVISGTDSSVICAQGMAVINVPYGHTKSITLKGWQNAGSAKDVTCAYSVVRVS